MRPKQILTIQDISGYGKCAATIALPVLSAAGHSVSLLPTAVLSTHTGGLGNNTCLDLTGQIAPITAHWASLGLTFDAIYTGYAASSDQLAQIKNAIERLRMPHTRLLVDPAMADQGRLYRSCSPDLVNGMRGLCREADWITPNITEAFLLLGEPYRDGPYDQAFLQAFLRRLGALGPKWVVLTGVESNGSVFAYGYCGEQDFFCRAETPLVPGHYHGTGDLFSSALLAALLSCQSFEDAVVIAAKMTYRAVLRTNRENWDPRHGLLFEPELPVLWQSLAGKTK